MALFMNQGLNKGLNSWLAHMERRALMRTALLAMVHRATKTCLNTWVAEAERRAAARAKFEAAAFTLRNLPLKKAINSFRAAVAANAPLRRAMAHWKNQPISRALFALKAHAAMLRKLKAQMHRWKHVKLTKALNSWIARTSKRGSARKRAVLGIINRPQRLALNTWLSFWRGRRRLAGLLNTFRNPAKRRGFNQWRAVTKPSGRKGPKSPPKSPHQWRMIKAMTWRECCSWLTRVGIPVSRSPPTLIRTLKEGFVYQELVRKISPAYYVRHKVAQCHETNGVFLMVQQFLDTELVISYIGCQKLDVIALESGKVRIREEPVDPHPHPHPKPKPKPNPAPDPDPAPAPDQGDRPPAARHALQDDTRGCARARGRAQVGVHTGEGVRHVESERRERGRAGPGETYHASR